MKRKIVQTEDFEDSIKDSISKKRLSKDDFEDFKKSLVENPKQGAVVAGTGGIRKTRLKSISKGKRLN